VSARPLAVVTGAAVRVGRAIAVELARSGFDLLLHHRSRPAEIGEVREACAAHGATVGIVAADLATVAGCEAVIAAAAPLGPVSALVNNASVFPAAAFVDIDAAAWDQVQAINVRAPFLLSRGLLDQLRAADATRFGAPESQGGVVVHLCDIGAERPVSGYAHYSASKAALVMLVKAMAVELAPKIRTVGVSPGQVCWPEGWEPEQRERIRKRIPLARVGTAEEVASLVRFLVTEAHYLNGVVVPVDGGLGVRY
jgi:pteridine reductase